MGKQKGKVVDGVVELSSMTTNHVQIKLVLYIGYSSLLSPMYLFICKDDA